MERQRSSNLTASHERALNERLAHDYNEFRLYFHNVQLAAEADIIQCKLVWFR